MTAATPLLAIRDLRAAYGKIEALKSVDLEIHGNRDGSLEFDVRTPNLDLTFDLNKDRTVNLFAVLPSIPSEDEEESTGEFNLYDGGNTLTVRPMNTGCIEVELLDEEDEESFFNINPERAKELKSALGREKF